MTPLIAVPTALPDPYDPAKLDAMMALVDQLLVGREAHKAGLVERGDPIPAAVETSVRFGRALAGQWAWVVDRTAGLIPEHDHNGPWGAWPDELAEDTAIAADRARQRAGSGDAAAIELAERCELLAWYQYCGRALYGRIVTATEAGRFSRAWFAARQAA